MKTAIVHDWITNPGGAETVLQCMLELFPDAPVYTAVYNRKKMSGYFPDTEIHTSFLDRMPFSNTKYPMYLGWMPRAFEQFDLRGYDLVLSSSTSCAKGVLTDAGTLHVCYCNTPMRYAWDFYFDYLDQSSNPVRQHVVRRLMHRIRIWDVLSSNRVDYFIANSHNVAARIEKHYRRESTVIYPPVSLPDVDLNDCEPGMYYLVVSRLVPYKRIDLAVEAFRSLHLPLIVAGDGSECKALKKAAGPDTRFVGRVPEAQKDDLFRHCRGFIFPGEEDFGITPVEAQGYGKPVIAFGKGGALETVIDGKTGIHFDEQTPDSLAEAVQRAEQTHFDPQEIRENARTFDRSVFRDRLCSFLQEKMQEFQGQKGVKW